MTQTQGQKLLGLIRGTYTWTNFDKLDLVVDTTDGVLADKQNLYREMAKRQKRYCNVTPTCACGTVPPPLYRLVISLWACAGPVERRLSPRRATRAIG